MKIKKSSVAIYTLALMLVTAGYWNYISQESKTIETMNVSQSEQKENDEENFDCHDTVLPKIYISHEAHKMSLYPYMFSIWT